MAGGGGVHVGTDDVGYQAVLLHLHTTILYRLGLNQDGSPRPRTQEGSPIKQIIG
jgi:hypothetical protein